MSVIIGCVREGKVVLATDTQRTRDDIVTRAKTDFSANVRRTPEGILVGVVGDQTIKRGVAGHPEWFSDLSGELLTKRYIMERIVPDLYREAKALGQIDERSQKNGRAIFDGMILLAQKDRLFCIDGDFSTVVIPDFCAVGRDADFAAAHLKRFYRKELSDEETAACFAAALGAVAACSLLSSAPFMLYDTSAQDARRIGG